MSNHSKYNSNTCLIDLMSTLGLTFIFLYAIVATLINQEKQHGNIISPVEFLIRAQWPNERLQDVDLYLKDPLGKITYFQALQQGMVNLERDDTGYGNDKIQTPFGLIEYKQNIENISIRASMPGEYTVSVHLYSRRGDLESCPVTVTIEKMTPFKLIYSKKVTLNQTGDEETICRFTVDGQGKVVDVNELKTNLVKLKYNNYPDFPNSPDYPTENPEDY